MRLLVLKVVGILGAGLFGFGVMQGRAIAQITPDGTLGSDASRVQPNVAVPGGVGVLIDRGAIRGTSVFHSFSDFNVSVPTYFAGQGFTNILARVTGVNQSVINNTLGVIGTADLFLINPRGILFGPNARLDIAGSFVASTADRINLANGDVFSAVNPTMPLLTLDVKPGLQTGVTYQGAIVNQGNLAVSGDIEFAAQRLEVTGGFINGAPGREIRIIAPTIVLSEKGTIISDVQPGDNINGSNISIKTQSLTGTGGSTVIARTLGNGNAGDILIEPFDPTQPSTISFDGVAPFIKLQSNGFPDGGFSSGILISTENAPGQSPATGNGGFLYISGITNVNLSNSAVISGRSLSSGNGGNVALDVKNLSLTSGAQVNVPAYRSGNPGNMVINAETVTISGTDPSYSLRFKSIVEAAQAAGQTETQARQLARFTVDTSSEASGLEASIIKPGKTASDNAGFVIVNASSALRLSNQAQISSSTFGQSDAGLIVLSTGKVYANALELLNAASLAKQSNDLNQWLSLGGGGQILLDNARVFSTVERGATGNAGQIYVTTGLLQLQNAGQIQTIVRGAGNGESGGVGNSGLIAVKATDSVRLTGSIEKVQDGKLQRFGSGLLSSVGEGAIGDTSGLIAVRTPLLYLNDGAYITTSNFSPQGQAGYIVANTDFTVLDRNSLLSSVSRSGRGGNIGIKSRYLVGVSRGSDITTESGSALQGGNGGNVAIGRDLTIDDATGDVRLKSNSPTLLIYGFPYKDSNVKANAFQGKGGNIELSTLTLRNLAKGVDTPISDDLDASSKNVAGLDGIVNANSYNIDPDRGLQPMPDKFKDYRLSEGCDPSTRREDNAFRQTGSGKIATDPSDRLELKVATRSTVGETEKPASTQALVPAIGWTKAPDGSIQMIAANHSGVALPKVPALCPT
jgi:filamentous hemagglutinin family protein